MNTWTVVALVFVGMALAEVWYNFMGYWQNSRRAKELEAEVQINCEWLRQFHVALTMDGAFYDPVTSSVLHPDGFTEDADAFCIAHELELISVMKAKRAC